MQKILVSEDSIIVNQHICKTLEGSGYVVYSAFTGKEAVRKANEHHPDLILMDIMMESKSDGIEAALEIKNTLDIPIIFLTALTDEGTLDKVKDSQPYGYIVKPFNEVELLSNIQVAIHKSKAENEVKNNRDLLQASINSINQAFFLIDADDKLFYLNTRAEFLLGKNFTSLVGENSALLPIYEPTTGEHVDLIALKNEDGELLFQKELVLKNKTTDIPIGDFILKHVVIKGGSFYTVFLFRDITDRVKARELEIELEKRRITSLIEGQENERDRLAREIHDGIGQMINLIKLKIKALPESEQKNELAPILDQTLEEVRNVSENLHPSRLSDFSLEKNLEKLVIQFNQNSGIKFQFSSSDVPDLNLTMKTHLFRIAQEAISNIVKHSKAKAATIQLYGLDNQIQLTIEDDGIGYQPIANTNGGAHHGIQNIEYRVNSMNGNFTVDSNDKSGTMLLITVPT